MVHELKCWTIYFQSILTGEKEFEVRINDRGFKVGDSLLLKEWDETKEQYTKRQIIKRITYMIQGTMGLPENVCVMQLR